MEIQIQGEIVLFNMNTNYSFSNDATSPSFDGRCHTPDDDCGAEDASHLNFAKTISDRQINYLKSLPASRQAMALDAVGATPTQRAKKVLLNYTIHQPGSFLTKTDINLAFQDCYTGVCADSCDTKYLLAVIEAIIDRTKEDALTKGEGLKEGAEQLLALASRMVKGQGCGECGAGVGLLNRVDVHNYTLDGLKELEEVGKELNLDWQLSDRGVFSLNKLRTVYGDLYDQVKHLAEPCGPRDFQQLEEMWCHETTECDCWDGVEGAWHSQMCDLNEF